MTRPIEVVVVGGGASGALVAARILDATHAQPARVTVVESTGTPGMGIAYGTDDPDHSLNVRVSGMSADPSRPGEFTQWGARHDLSDPTAFVPRHRYRAYLADHLSTAADSADDGALDVVAERAIGMSGATGGSASCEVQLASGRALRADAVVVATGNAAPGTPGPLHALAGHRAWIADPWVGGALQRLEHAHSIVMIGTGLTAVDVILTAARTTDAEMFALSRHGLFPAAHVADLPLREIDVAELFAGADTLGALTRGLVARTREPDEGFDWRDVIDSVRPVVNAYWTRLDDDERRRFVTRLARFWDVHRHRMPPRSAVALDSLRASGRLTTRAARIVGADAGSSPGAVTLDLLVDGRVEQVTADAVVNCTGPRPAWRPGANPFVADLVARGLAVVHPTGLGLATSPVGQLVDHTGRPTSNAFVIGPPRRGALWESTAVPEIRSQALHIADRVVIGGHTV